MEGEEEDPSDPNQTLDQPAVAAAHPKHAAMLQRISDRKQQHQSHSHSRQSDSTRSFLSLFSQSKLSIDSQISQCRHQSTNEPEPNLKSDLEQIFISICDLEKLVAQNSYSLPSFEVRTCLDTVSNLKQTLDTLASDLVPKKRFSFKNKKAPISDVNVIEAETRVMQSENQSNTVRDLPGFEEREEKANSGAIELGKPSFRVWDSPGFKGRENEVLVREFKGMEMGEFSISDLHSCEVRLTGCLRALFVHKLRDCKVYVGPVFGSVLIEEVEGCVFVLASHQIRIHHAKGSDFYLRVRSRPIIEDCSGVRIAPYCLGYDGIERDLKESNLDEETGNWSNVDDFRWLKGFQSPNWSILPESEWIGRVTIMNSDK